MQPLSFGQQLHRFETAFEYYGNLFFGVHHYAFEQLADDLVIVFHRTVLYAVEYHIDVIESGFCVFSPLFSVGYAVELLLQTAFFVHEPSCGFHDCCHNSLLQYAFFYGRRMVAVFFAVVKTIYASPYDFLFAACRPSASAVGGFAFAADEQFCQSVFA